MKRKEGLTVSADKQLLTIAESGAEESILCGVLVAFW